VPGLVTDFIGAGAAAGIAAVQILNRRKQVLAIETPNA
jgi:hypothetical protein